MGNISQTPFIPTPQALHVPGVENATATAAVTAGAAYAAPVQLLAPVTATQMRCSFSGSPTGNIDMGIFDSTGTNGGPGNLLGHTGANAAATGVFTKSLTANLLLSPGLYWLAFLDTVADTLVLRQPNTGMGVMVRTSATNLTVLGSSFGAFADNNTLIAMLALLSGSFS